MMTNQGNRVTQGQFSFLPDLTDAQITKQIEYALKNDWAVSVEYTDDPHPRNTYWDMWGLPMFEMKDAAAVMMEVQACRKAHPDRYVRLNAYDARHTKQTVALSFIVHRPQPEPGFRLDRLEAADRQIRYTATAYVTQRPTGERYSSNGNT